MAFFRLFFAVPGVYPMELVAGDCCFFLVCCFRPADASGHSERLGVGDTPAGDVVAAQAPWETPNLKRRPR
jgi:hypothetical protein